MKLLTRLALFVFLGCSFSLQAQLQQNYISTGSTYSMGKVTLLKDGRISFKKGTYDEPVIYEVGEVKEYGRDGRIYELLSIDGNQTFVKRVVSGDLNLYRSGNFNAIKKGSTLTQFGRKDFRDVIGKAATCSGTDVSLSRLTYSPAALASFVTASNRGTCDYALLAHQRFGVNVGYQFGNFHSNVAHGLKVEAEIAAPTVGVFFERPFYEHPSFFLSAELSWMSSHPSFYHEDMASSTFVALDVNAINANFSSKWVLAYKRIRPYLRVGAFASFVSVSSPTGVIESNSDGTEISISQFDVSKSSAVLPGIFPAIGAEIPVRQRSIIHLELRFNQALDGNFDSFKMNFSGPCVSAGFSI